MQSTVTIPLASLVLIFLAGLIAGWFLGRMRLQSSVNVSFRPPGSTSDSKPSFAVRKTVRTLDLKCQCGATWRFHETSGHPDQGSQPMPTGDSFTCPQCGKTIDLREVHKLLPDVS